MSLVLWIAALLLGTGMIVWGAELFAEHLSTASVRLGVSTFALALLLAGAEPEELATVIAASLHGAPAIAIGDVIGANVAMCLVALAVGAWIAPLPFGKRVLLYAGLGLPLGGIAAWMAWNGEVSRLEGAALVALYALYVGGIWVTERAPPSLGEVREIEEARERTTRGKGRIGRELLLVLLGLLAMAMGASLLVEAIQQIAPAEDLQGRLGLTLVGFATAFELVVLAWSASRRGASEAVVAAVVGSFAYNVTMTLGAGALAGPLMISDAAALHMPWLAMLASLLLVLVLAARGSLGRPAAILLISAYAAFVALVVL